MAAMYTTWIVLIISSITGTICMDSYTMDKYCGKWIDMASTTTSFKLHLTDRSNYDRDMNCGLHIRAPPTLRQQVLVQFLDIDIHCSDTLQFYDGASARSPELGGPICGEKEPSALVTSGYDLYIRFTSDGRKEDDGFTLLINTFHTGYCGSKDYKCKNGRCIDKSLYCNKYDNCGDNSDSCNRDNWWIGMLVGIFILLVICVITAVICCCLCKRSKARKRNNQPAVHYQSQTQTITSSRLNPWYGPQAQPNQPQIQLNQTPYPTDQTMYTGPPMPQPPPYTPATDTSGYPPSQAGANGWGSSPDAPPPYTEKA